MLDNLYVRALVDLVHDLAAAVALAFPYTAWVIRSAAAKTPDMPLPPLAKLVWSLVGFAAFAVVVIVISGAVRLRYYAAVIDETQIGARNTGALIKHGLFVLTFIGGIVSAFVVASGLSG